MTGPFVVTELVGLPFRRKGRIVEFHGGAHGVVAIVAVGRRGILRAYLVPALRKLERP